MKLTELLLTLSLMEWTYYKVISYAHLPKQLQPLPWFQVGANMDQREQIYIQTMTAAALGLEDGQNAPISIQTPDEANQVIGKVDDALKTVSKQRADLGAYQNRFEMAVKGIDVAAENMQAAESLLRDTNMAGEMVKYVKNQILNQAGTAMLAQANVKTQGVVQLLG